jgi:hypothetical protein
MIPNPRDDAVMTPTDAAWRYDAGDSGFDIWMAVDPCIAAHGRRADGVREADERQTAHAPKHVGRLA